MKILVMGLPGAGKTWLAERLVQHLENCAWFNADHVRKAANDWDFTPQGRIRQAKRMNTYANFETGHGRWVICDFVAPTKNARKEFNAEYVIWLDTIPAGRFEDTNKMFEKPENYDHRIDKFLSDDEIKSLAFEIREVPNNEA